jgi:hypothetical protein
VLSRTVEATARCANATGMTWDYAISHGEPLPRSHNRALEKGYAFSDNWLWLVEEDVEPPEDALAVMFAEAHQQDAIMVCDYKLRGGSRAAVIAEDGELLYAGVGCVLMRVQDFGRLPLSVFSTERQWHCDAKRKIFTPAQSDSGAYGRLDVDFYVTLRVLDMRYKLSSVMCEHYEVKRWGDTLVNDGVHEIARC